MLIQLKNTDQWKLLHHIKYEFWTKFKGALSGLRPFLATESHFKNDKNPFLFRFKSSFRSQYI